jgi:hypothetical protein
MAHLVNERNTGKYSLGSEAKNRKSKANLSIIFHPMAMTCTSAKITIRMMNWPLNLQPEMTGGFYWQDGGG